MYAEIVHGDFSKHDSLEREAETQVVVPAAPSPSPGRSRACRSESLHTATPAAPAKLLQLRSLTHRKSKFKAELA